MVPVNCFGLLNNRTRIGIGDDTSHDLKLIGIIVRTTVMVTALMYNYITQIYVDAIMYISAKHNAGSAFFLRMALGLNAERCET